MFQWPSCFNKLKNCNISVSIALLLCDKKKHISKSRKLIAVTILNTYCYVEKSHKARYSVTSFTWHYKDRIKFDGTKY